MYTTAFHLEIFQGVGNMMYTDARGVITFGITQVFSQTSGGDTSWRCINKIHMQGVSMGGRSPMAKHEVEDNLLLKKCAKYQI